MEEDIQQDVTALNFISKWTKKQRIEDSKVDKAHSKYIDVSYIDGTSNDIERLFSKVALQYKN
jgi:hypothetical protein